MRSTNLRGSEVKGTLTYAAAFIAQLLIGLLFAVVFHDFWNWFVSPLGVQRIGIAHAWGLILLAALIIPGKDWRKEIEEAESPFAPVFGLVVGVLVAWGVGAVLSSMI